MPKLKTHKGASKRFKKTGTGKVMRSHAFGRHILTSKPRKRKKKLHERVMADGSFERETDYLTTRIFAGETHSTAWPLAFGHGLKVLLGPPDETPYLPDFGRK